MKVKKKFVFGFSCWYMIFVSFLECSIPIVEPEVHEETICVEPVRSIDIERDEEPIELNENMIDIEPLEKQEFSDNFENIVDDDDDDVFDNDNSSVFLDSNVLPNRTESNGLPQHISDVNPKQQQQIIDQYFDMNCELCETVFNSLEDAISHYAINHNNPRGYIRCCQLKFASKGLLNWHIVWHLNPEVFK